MKYRLKVKVGELLCKDVKAGRVENKRWAWWLEGKSIRAETKALLNNTTGSIDICKKKVYFVVSRTH